MPLAVGEAEKYSYLCNGKWIDFTLRQEQLNEWTVFVDGAIGIARDKETAREMAYRIIESKFGVSLPGP